MIKYFFNKIEEQNKTPTSTSADSIEKKNLLSEYFKEFLQIFESFDKKENKENLTIVLNSIKELKETYCTFCILKIILKPKNWIKEQLRENNRKNRDKQETQSKEYIEIDLPDKKLIRKEIGAYFLEEKNEKEEKEYSEINYYYISEGEEEMIKNKKITIGDYEFNIELNTDIY